MTTMHEKIAAEFGAFSLSEDCTAVTVNYGELTNLIDRYHKVRADNDGVRNSLDSTEMELKTLRNLYLDKTKKVEDLEKELLHLRGFAEAVKIMCGKTKLYE